MSRENVELVRRAYEVINAIGRTDEFVDPEELYAEARREPRDIVDLGHAVVVETRIIGLGRGSDVPFEADETDVFWFRDGSIVKLQGFPTREDAFAAAEAGG